MNQTIKKFWNWLTEIDPITDLADAFEMEDRQEERKQLEAKIRALELQMEHLRYQPTPTKLISKKVTKEDIVLSGIKSIAKAKRTEDKIINACVVGAYLLLDKQLSPSVDFGDVYKTIGAPYEYEEIMELPPPET